MKDLAVVVITIEKEPMNWKQIQSYFPQAQILKGVDLRGKTPDELLNHGYITARSAHVMKLGRKWHHELPSPGSVGLYQSWRKALAKDYPGWLLLCEHDVLFNQNIKTRVEYLMNAEFDIAVIGPNMIEAADKVHPTVSDFVLGPTYYFGTHCLLFSPTGILKMREVLKEKQEVQVDFLLTLLSKNDTYNIIFEHKTKSASQSLINSSSINSQLFCDLCNVPPISKTIIRGVINLPVLMAYTVIVIVMSLIFLQMYQKFPDKTKYCGIVIATITFGIVLVSLYFQTSKLVLFANKHGY